MSKDNDELVSIILSTEEWQIFECKRANIKPAKLLETVVAFANTNGGTIVLGLEDPKKAKDEKRLIGISENLDNVSSFLALLAKEIDPPLIVYSQKEIVIINSEGKEDKLILLKIEKSDDVHSLKNGDTFVRKGNQNQKIGAKEITRIKYEKGSIQLEAEIINIDTFNDIDKDLLRQFKKDTGGKPTSDWQFLKDNGLASKKGNKFLLTKGGGLLFGKNPSVLLSGKFGIKISRFFGSRATYTGTPNLVHKPFTIEGPLLYQINEAIDYFKDVVKNSPPKLSGSTFKPSLLIPESAFQEAVTNAVVHRNYSIQNDIQVRFFDDHIEIESPGTYPGHVTPSNIRSERFARNPIIQRTLNRFDAAPNLDIGEGVDRMFKAMRQKNLYDPIYLPPTYLPNSVMVILYNLQKIEYWDTVSNFLEENYRITNEQARKITGVPDSVRMSRLLKQWVESGLLKKADGRSKKDMYYYKPGQGLPASLFS
ncbi:MAG: hypothetical protein JWM92_591 [Candidatus Nomurabacteria bacterium]|nr:hypothetical protein [Candidatus Nomurabacteria bacterium]